MIDDWAAKCPFPPSKHQLVGVNELLKMNDPTTGRVIAGCFMLADEMGSGKTKHIVDTAQILYHRGELQQVMVVTLGSIRSVWADKEFGEIIKHTWDDTPTWVVEYCVNRNAWYTKAHKSVPNEHRLHWIVTNYEYVRGEDHFEELAEMCRDRRTMFVLDESSAVKNSSAIQTKRCLKLRQLCKRVALLNGTPISQSPMDIYSQAMIMHPGILGCKSPVHFRARYATMGGWKGKQITGWHDLEDLQKKLAPYVLRRLKSDCLDLPEKMPPVTMTVPLSPATWKIYRQMRDEMVAWLDIAGSIRSDSAGVEQLPLWLQQSTGASVPEGTEHLTSRDVNVPMDRLKKGAASIAKEAGVKALRLSQITSGFLGGVESVVDCAVCDGAGDDCQECGGTGGLRVKQEPQNISSEKTDLVITWIQQRLEQDPNLKLMLWCKWRPELFRLVRMLRHVFPNMDVGQIVGGQDKDERQRAIRLLDPRSAPEGPATVVGTPSSGGKGLTLVAADHAMHVSAGYSVEQRLQADDRTHRTGQLRRVWYGEILATGPQGQKTIDHAILKGLREKQNIAMWTADAWRRMLTEE